MRFLPAGSVENTPAEVVPDRSIGPFIASIVLNYHALAALAGAAFEGK